MGQNRREPGKQLLFGRALKTGEILVRFEIRSWTRSDAPPLGRKSESSDSLATSNKYR